MYNFFSSPVDRDNTEKFMSSTDYESLEVGRPPALQHVRFDGSIIRNPLQTYVTFHTVFTAIWPPMGPLIVQSVRIQPKLCDTCPGRSEKLTPNYSGRFCDKTVWRLRVRFAGGRRARACVSRGPGRRNCAVINGTGRRTRRGPRPTCNSHGILLGPPTTVLACVVTVVNVGKYRKDKKT